MTALRRFFPFMIASAAALLAGGCASSGDPVEMPPRHTVLAVDSAKLQSDAGVEAALAPYTAEVEKLRQPITESTVELKPGPGERDLGYWVADQMRRAASEAIGRPVDAAFTNAGGIRSDLPKGPVSYATISRILPFENTVVVYEMTGLQLHEVAEVFTTWRGGMPVSGMSIEGNEEFELERVLIDGEPIDPEETYLVATNSFLAAGGGNMDILTTLPANDTGVFLRDAITMHLRDLAAEGKKIDPETDVHRYTYGGKTLEELE